MSEVLMTCELNGNEHRVHRNNMIYILSIVLGTLETARYRIKQIV